MGRNCHGNYPTTIAFKLDKEYHEIFDAEFQEYSDNLAKLHITAVQGKFAMFCIQEFCRMKQEQKLHNSKENQQ